MTPLRRTLAALLLGGATAATAIACLDLTPVIYQTAQRDARAPVRDAAREVAPPADAPQDAEEEGDASAPDAPSPGPCVSCIVAAEDASPPGCGAEVAACMANGECNATYECAIANQCFEQQTFQELVNCGVPCAEDAGIMTQSDPALTLIYDVAACAAHRCNGPCPIGDAAIGAFDL